MKIIEGSRDEQAGPANVTVRVEGAAPRPLAPRYDLRGHSPDGFQWGYEGSGPAQLALAICCEILDDDERAQRVYQDFKRKVITPMGGDCFTLTERFVREAIFEIERV